jgi:ssDNA-binding Zn-finger/Zn-ribbon topoisomerase 1
LAVQGGDYVIELKIEAYCQDCPHFEVETIAILSVKSRDFVLRCEHFEKCRRIYETKTNEVAEP